jgi:NAD+ kinase
MRQLLLLHHPKLPHSLALARQWSAQLDALGARGLIVSAWDEPAIGECIRDAELAITLGGDGTILRAARLCAPVGVPILGINLGRVGFLSELAPDEFDARAVLDRGYWIEERTMLRATFSRDGGPVRTFTALNDVVVGRGKLARVVRLSTYIDGDFLATFVADGAIVGTATGSTAYVAAAGGPILAPVVKTLVLVPIAPYLSQIRSLVLPEGSHVLLRLETDHGSILTIDGQIDIELQNGDEIMVQASDHYARFARFQPATYFYRTLVERLRERGAEMKRESTIDK